jgi:hypothetical protein
MIMKFFQFLFFCSLMACTSSSRRPAQSSPKNPEEILKQDHCWPLFMNRTSIKLVNPQSESRSSQFEEFDPEVLCFPYSIQNNFQWNLDESTTLNTKGPGLLFLLTNAQYLYSPDQFKSLVLALRRQASDGTQTQVFFKSYWVDNIDRDTSVSILEASDHFIVIFQGTTSGLDWAYNMNLIPQYVRKGDWASYYHQGFYTNYSAIHTQLKSVLERDPKKKVVLVGHSLGGALAQIFLARSLGEKNFFDSSRIHSIITWASPRAFSTKVSTFVEGELKAKGISQLRFSKPEDLIPHMPPLVLGYQALGQSVWRDPVNHEWLNSDEKDEEGFLNRPKEFFGVPKNHMGKAYFEIHAKELFEIP